MRTVAIDALERRTLLSEITPGVGPIEGGGPGRGSDDASESSLLGNLHINAIRLVDGRNMPITAPVLGQMIFIRAEYTLTGLNGGEQYVVRYWVDGVPADSAVITAQPGTWNWTWYRGGWYASPGPHDIQVTIDGNNSVQETDETDNTLTGSFTSAPVSGLTNKFVYPIGTRPNQDWMIFNYADIDPRPGQSRDYLDGPYQYDGHNAIDAGPARFSWQDAGVSIHAAAAGTVTEVRDGGFDRETTFNSRPANYVLLDHGGGWQTAYLHFAANTITVAVGDVVTPGQMLGLMGSSGSSTGTHLHFTVIKGGAAVETGYAASDYWVAPLPYSGSVAPFVMDAGTSNYNEWPEHQERVSDVELFPTSSGWNAWYWASISNVHPSDVVRVNWYRPGGTLATFFTYSPPEHYRFANYAWYITPGTWSPFPGEWEVALLVNNVELNRRSFTVTSGAGEPEIKVAQHGAVVLDERTTPFDFGTTTLGAPVTPQLVFAVHNHGATTLTLGAPELPPGFALASAFPTSVAPGDFADFTVRLESTRAGAKLGEIRIPTNDADESVFNFNLSGTVTGSAPAGAPNLTLNGAALPFWSGAPARLLAPGAILTDDNATYGNATLRVELAGGAQAGDRLLVLPQGAGPGQVDVQGASVRYGGAVVGTLSGGTGGAPLLVTFNASATPAIAQAVARRIAYVSDLPAPVARRRYIRFTVSDPGAIASEQPVKVVSFDNLVRPRVTGSAFHYETAPQEIRVSFTRPVGASLATADLELRNLTSGDPIATGDIALTYDAPSNTATFRFPNFNSGALPDGRYRATLRGTGVTDTLGIPLVADHVLDFTFLRGDANADGTVNLQDFNILAINFGQMPRTFTQGDFNYDGRVNLQDFNVLASRFGAVLGPGPEQRSGDSDDDDAGEPIV